MCNKLIVVIFLLILLLLLYFLQKNKNNLKTGTNSDGGGIEDMPDGPAKDNALKRQKEIQEKMSQSVPKSKETVFNNFPIQQRIKKYVNEYGRSFVTYVYLYRLYFPSMFENPITNKMAWIPLDGDDNIHLRIPIPGTPITLPNMVPNLKELEVMTDRMFSHSLPLPHLFMLDISITQLDILAKWYKKYYIDKKYPEKENYYVGRTRRYIESL